MTISYIGEDHAGTGSGMALVFDNLPVSTASGDILIASIMDDASGSDWTLSGWTVLDYIESGSSRLTILYHELTAAPDASYSFDASSITYRCGVLSVWRKTTGTWNFVTQTGSLDYTEEAGSGSTTLQMDATDSVTDGMLITSWGNDGSRTVTSSPGSQTPIRYESRTSVALAVYYESTSDTGTEDSITWSASDEMTNISFALTEGGGSSILPIKFTLGQIEHKPNIVLHDFPYKTGSTDYLIGHWKCDDDAANSTVVAATGDDANWEVNSTGVDRNTDNDSVNGALDTKGLYNIIPPFGIGTIHDNAFLKKGCIIIEVTPQFEKAVASNQYIFSVARPASNNFVELSYRALGDEFRFYVMWNGTISMVLLPVSSDLELQQSYVFTCWWDESTDTLGLVINGKIIDVVTNTGTPNTNPPSQFVIGASGANLYPSDYIIHNIKTINTPILPYGAYFTGNSGTTQLDDGMYHKDITFYSDCESLTADSIIGDASLTSDGALVTGLVGTYAIEHDNNGDNTTWIVAEGTHFDFDKGCVGFWINMSSITANGEIFRFYSSASESDNRIDLRPSSSIQYRLTYQRNGASLFAYKAMTLAGENDGLWHWWQIKWDFENEVLELWKDNILFTDGIFGSWPTVGGTDPDRFALGYGYGSASTVGLKYDQVYITNNPNTPQIPTANGVPIDMPIVRND
jgi:hypothetical protein